MSTTTNQDGGRAARGSLARGAPLVAGGALTLFGLSRRSLPGLALALAGAAVAYRGATGKGPARPLAGQRAPTGPVRVVHAATVNRPAGDVYRFWRDLPNLARVMPHLRSVEVRTGARSHWVAVGPGGRTIEWDAEIVRDEPERAIAWRAVEGAPAAMEGEVRFVPAPGNRGTEVHVSLAYQPPAGTLGAAAARLVGLTPGQEIAEGLRHAKQLLEAGEIPTTAGQPSGPRRVPVSVESVARSARQALEAAKVIGAGREASERPVDLQA